MDFSEQWQHFLTADGLISLLTLTLLEIVLGIDNIIFVSIIAGKLTNKNDQRSARNIGLLLAMLIRIALLFGITYIISMQEPLFTIFGQGFSGRDLILLGGGIFLLVKTVSEIHSKIEGGTGDGEVSVKRTAFFYIVIQIVLIDIVFSFDSILTAIGVVDNVLIMIGAVIISMLIMMASSGAVSDFIEKHPTIKMLALAFLLMIGVLLVAEAFHQEIPKAYVYCSMGFAFLVEFLNIRARKPKK